jgi:hypothetical protein
MRLRSNSGKVCLGVGLLLAITGAVFLSFVNREGAFSYSNFERIRTGMTLAEVERLLGETGNEINESFVPLIVVGQPKQQKQVVSGGQYYRWENGNSYVIVSFRKGLVAEKYYWEPSL